MRRVVVEAPAKLNLGLEVLGRRPDGYHDLVTVMQTVSIVDRLVVAPAAEVSLSASDPALGGDDNLALTAIRALHDRQPAAGGASIRLDKRIPTAAGLGGASSDAAATLLAARRLWDAPLGDDDLAALAVGLGSDVPFFLHGGTALVTGRGERIEPLPPLPPTWFVVVVPAVSIPRKTATFYGALTAADFSSGDRVRRLAERLRCGGDLDPSALGNAFARALYARCPELSRVDGAMRRAGAPFVALSGAGPSHFTAAPTAEMAEAMAGRVRLELGDEAVVLTCEPLPGPPRPPHDRRGGEGPVTS